MPPATGLKVALPKVLWQNLNRVSTVATPHLKKAYLLTGIGMACTRSMEAVQKGGILSIKLQRILNQGIHCYSQYLSNRLLQNRESMLVDLCRLTLLLPSFFLLCN